MKRQQKEQKEVPAATADHNDAVTRDGWTKPIPRGWPRERILERLWGGKGVGNILILRGGGGRREQPS